MAENNEYNDSTSSFVLEEDNISLPKEETICSAKELRRVEITVEPEEKLLFLETISVNNSDSEISYMTPAIQEALNFDLTNSSYDAIVENNVQLRYYLCRIGELLKEKTGLCQNLEKQITTLQLQTNSLKDLVTVTKDLLSIRNMEVMGLQEENGKLEERIEREMDKHKHLLSNMDGTVKSITKMKEEHQLQMDRTAATHEEYKKKIEFLEKENLLLSNQTCGEEPLSIPLPITIEKVGEGDTHVQEDLIVLPQ